VIFINSCDTLNKDNITIEMDKETFLKERNEWDNLKLKNYQFAYDYFNDAGRIGPVKITIKENMPPFIENLNQSNGYIIAENISEIYNYINGTFEFIESVQNGTFGEHKMRSITLNITYNIQYHYPTTVNLSTGYVESAGVGGGAYYTLNITYFSELK
jgi:hypothetical protein